MRGLAGPCIPLVAGIAVFALHTAGLAEQQSPPRPLSLEQAFQLALENNPTFFILKQDVESARGSLEIEEGAASPKLVGDLHVSYDNVPGRATSIEITDRQLSAVVGVQGRADTGLDYRLEWNTLLQDLDGISTIYSLLHSTTLQLTLVQPLLRNAWVKVNDAPIVIAAHRLDATKALLRARAEALIADVEVAYWSLLLARNELEIRQQAVDLARQQVEDSKKQLKLGSGTQVDVLEADSELKQTLEELPVAEQVVVQAESALLALIAPRGPADEILQRYLPSTAPTLNPVTEAPEELIAVAEKNRADLAAAMAQVEASEVAREVAENRLWPALNLFASVGVTGFSGTLSTGYGTAGFNTEVIHGITQERLPPIDPDSALESGLGGAYKNLRYPSGTVGLRFEVPFDRDQAMGTYRRENAELSKRRAETDDLKTRISLQVITAVRQLHADLQGIDATGETLEVSESLLEAQRRRFNNGDAVSFDVSRASAAVTRSRIALARAKVRARISEARVALAQGVYLEKNHISLSADEQSKKTQQ